MIVPLGQDLVTADEFERLPDQDRYELVDGWLVEKPEMGLESTWVAGRVYAAHLLQVAPDEAVPDRVVVGVERSRSLRRRSTLESPVGRLGRETARLDESRGRTASTACPVWLGGNPQRASAARGYRGSIGMPS